MCRGQALRGQGAELSCPVPHPQGASRQRLPESIHMPRRCDLPDNPGGVHRDSKTAKGSNCSGTCFWDTASGTRNKDQMYLITPQEEQEGWVGLLLFCFSFFMSFFLINYFNWRLIYNIVVVFGIHQHESATVYMCPNIPIPSLWVVPVLWLWVPCFTNQTWTGHLFHIW